ncbi:MAG: type VI secretion system tip protein VgrG [Puniceicoccaceae bacterium]|nr:MAG: type VI secretion system tip protein VgrG [Puniceicoccaceae bacterium]
MPIKQESRAYAFSTPLGEDVLIPARFAGVEELGRPFRYDLELVSEDPAVDPDQLLAQNVTLRLQLHDGGTRYFNGVVSRFWQTGFRDDIAHYRAEIVPWFWLLTQAADCRIFQEKHAVDIVEDILRDSGLGDHELRLSTTYPVREFCVQYRESHFDFISRLLEEEGIAYYFKVENGKHTLILADSAGAHDPCPDLEEAHWHQPSKTLGDAPYVTSWIRRQTFRTTRFAHHDFDFNAPRTSLLAKSLIQREHANANLEVFDYPGFYSDVSEGERLANVRLQEIQAGHQVFEGTSTIRSFTVGHKFTLSDHPTAAHNREYLLTRVTHELVTEFAEGFKADGKEKYLYQASLEAIPSDVPFRPARLTPRPFIRGPQTAIVVGPSGEEIHTDVHGRIKVQFPWDRRGAYDDTSSCWIRVAQEWAGKNWGALFLPRIGQEVMVEFLEGDPDRPIITGRLYNGDQKPPYALPDNKTVSTMRSLSSKDGGGYNELRFQDLKGQEMLFLHAEKDHHLKVKNDSVTQIGHDQHEVVEQDSSTEIKNNRNLVVGAEEKHKVAGDRHVTVEGKEAKKVAGTQSLKVDGDVAEEFGGDQSVQISNDLYLKAGSNIVIEAGSNLTLKVGNSFIAIEGGGIKIGTNGDIVLEAKGKLKGEGTGGLELKAAAQAKMEGSAGIKISSPAMAELSTTGICTVKGSLVKIN